MMNPLDDYVKCQNCEASSHDIVGRRGDSVALECMFCGWVQWEDAPPDEAVAPAVDEFRFVCGRFTGSTFAQVLLAENGRQYLEWVQANAIDKNLIERVKAFMEAQA